MKNFQVWKSYELTAENVIETCDYYCMLYKVILNFSSVSSGSPPDIENVTLRGTYNSIIKQQFL